MGKQYSAMECSVVQFISWILSEKIYQLKIFFQLLSSNEGVLPISSQR